VGSLFERGGLLPLLCVHFRVPSCGIVLVLKSFQIMTEGNPGMMRGLLVIARFVKLGGLAMMFGSVFKVLRCMFVKFVNLVLCHSVLPVELVSASTVETAPNRCRSCRIT
jgi:hypothetical protein